MIPAKAEMRKVILMIADISGYTRFMVSNAKTLAHSQTIITELIDTIIKEVEVPLEIAKLEGDAVFLYGIKTEGEAWREKKARIGEKLIAFFRAFSEKLTSLAQSTHCNCNACRNIDRLKLKLIVHSGEALFHHVGRFEELAGVDVILVHKLLKNSVASDQYILMTSPGFHDLEFPSPIHAVKGREEYEEIGTVETFLYLPPSTMPEAREKLRQQYQTLPLTSKIKNSNALNIRLWKGQMALGGKLGKQSMHLSSEGVSPGRQRAFAVFSRLLLPFFLPASLLVGALRNLTGHRWRETPPRRG